MDRQHYESAPITEAIIDLKVDLPPAARVAELEYVHKWIRGEYPESAPRQMAMGRIELGDRVSASAQSEQVGYVFTSADKKQIAQAQLSGFSFSRLAPYESWEPFRDEARRVWGFYRKAAAPVLVSRLAVRNINRIDIPEKNVDLKKYFRTSPEISTDLPQTMSGFVMQVQLPIPEIRAIATISQTIVPPPNENTVSVVLDIDLFRHENVPQDEADIWTFFEALRDEKNKVFEACITPTTRKLFAK